MIGSLFKSWRNLVGLNEIGNAHRQLINQWGGREL